MDNVHNDIILTPDIRQKDNILKVLYLPKTSYIIFYEKDGKYNILNELKIETENSNIENINTYYNETSNIKDNELIDVKYIINMCIKDIQLCNHININNNKEASELTEKIFTVLLNTLDYDVLYFNDELPNDEIQFTTQYQRKLLNKNDETIYKKIYDYQQEVTNTNLIELRNQIIFNLKTSKQQRNTQRLLSTYLNKKYSIILRKETGHIYKLDGMGYTELTHDDLILLLKNDFGDNLVHDDDINKSIGYISERLEPKYNIIKFNNCLYDINKHEVIKVREPVFTLVESKYNYNPNAQSTILKQFLYTSLERETLDETEKAVHGVLEIVGYLFTSGNKYNIFPVITGKTGGGKSVFGNILTNIFGNNKIADLSLQEMEKNTHGTSSLCDTHLNFIRDSDETMIENNSFIKKLTGNENIQVNPKHKQQITLVKEEVPKTIMFCNAIPEFKEYSEALLSRMVIIEFLVQFRDTTRQDPDLLEKIINNPEEVEWLIYNSLEAYKLKENKNDGFILKISPQKTEELIHKHTNPLLHTLKMLIQKHDPQAYMTEKELNPQQFKPIINNELSKVILHLGKKEGVQIPINNNGEIKKNKLLNTIKTEFDLWDGEDVFNKYSEEWTTRPYKTRTERTSEGNKRVYPNLIAKPLYFKILDELKNNINKN